MVARSRRGEMMKIMISTTMPIVSFIRVLHLKHKTVFFGVFAFYIAMPFPVCIYRSKGIVSTAES